MALTLEQLQAQREQIISEMGQPDVAFADRSIKRRPQSELKDALARVDAELAKLQGSQSTVFTITSNRGLTS
jgi:hypothetical protein